MYVLACNFKLYFNLVIIEVETKVSCTISCKDRDKKSCSQVIYYTVKIKLMGLL